MLNYLKSLFKKDFQMFNISLITANIAEIISCIEDEYMNDPLQRNNAIDAVINLLQEHKE